MNDKTLVSLSSLSMDLKRVSLGLYRGSNVMAQKFLEEALLRHEEIDINNVAPYIRRLLDNFKSQFSKGKASQSKAEDALMYSILFQNYCRKH